MTCRPEGPISRCGTPERFGVPIKIGGQLLEQTKTAFSEVVAREVQRIHRSFMWDTIVPRAEIRWQGDYDQHVQERIHQRYLDGKVSFAEALAAYRADALADVRRITYS